MDEILTRLSNAELQLTSIKSKVARRDLRKMIGHIDSVITEISKESVECRRLKKETNRYQQLNSDLSVLLDSLEQHITLALLLG
jgi:hypothetical protein